MTARDKFLRDQDNLRRRAQQSHADRLDNDASRRQNSFFQRANERDQKIRDDIDARDRARRNAEYKKSVFYAELQQAKAENRAPIYASYMSVPDLEEPEPPAPSPWGTLALAGVIGILAVGAIIWAIFHYLGGIILGVLVAIAAAYAITTGVWLYLTRVKTPATPEEAARADAWNPITLTRRGLALIHRRPAAGEHTEDTPDAPRTPGQPNPAHFDRDPESEVYQPQYFNPGDVPPHQ